MSKKTCKKNSKFEIQNSKFTPKEHCGLFGVFGHKEATYLTYLGLYALQHRGEESCGIVSSDGQNMFQHKQMGQVAEVFNEEIIKKLSGDRAIGHVRYSTTGSSLLKNAQPLLVDYSKGTVAIAHNGNLVNAVLLRSELEAHGSIFQTTLDSEILIHLMAKSEYRDCLGGLIGSLKYIQGAYCFLLLTKKQLIGVRDPHGFRPLWIGKLADSFVLASETPALDLIEAEVLREVQPGEVVVIDNEGLHSIMPPQGKKIKPAFCIFEHIYFARPDSQIFGETVHLVRKRLGRELAKEHPVQADIVVPVPDSGVSCALGFSQASKIPLEYGIIRNHYIGRTFIQPSQLIRDFNVKIKFNLLKDVLRGRRVVVIDDSIVRGTTSKTRVRTLRQAGAVQVHMRISCPPHKFPCFYGIDFPTRKELIGSTHTLEEIAKFLDVDSIGYLSLDGMLRCVTAHPKDNYCVACFTGNYPIAFGGEGDKYGLEKKDESSYI